MNPNPIVVRGITISVAPLSQLRPLGRIRFIATFDERPLGRTMEAHFQRVLTLRGDADAYNPKVLASALANDLRGKAVLSPDFGLVVTNKAQRFSRQVPLRIRDELTSAIARELCSLAAPAS